MSTRKTTSTPPVLPRTAYTPREVAASTGLKYKRVLALIHTGQLAAIPVGPLYVIPAAALEEFLNSAQPLTA